MKNIITLIYLLLEDSITWRFINKSSDIFNKYKKFYIIIMSIIIIITWYIYSIHGINNIIDISESINDVITYKDTNIVKSIEYKQHNFIINYFITAFENKSNYSSYFIYRNKLEFKSDFIPLDIPSVDSSPKIYVNGDALWLKLIQQGLESQGKILENIDFILDNILKSNHILK